MSGVENQIWSTDLLTRAPSTKTTKTGMLYNWKFWVFLTIVIFIFMWIIVAYFCSKTSTTKSTNNKSRKRRIYYDDEDEDDEYDSDEEYEYRRRRPEPRERETRTEPREREVRVEPVEEFRDINLNRQPISIIETSSDIMGPERPSRNIDFSPPIPNYANHTGRQPERWKREGECRRVLETIYSVPFPKSYPDWLINDLTGRHLELDGYNSELQIAFEHMGKQHYDPDDRYNNNDEEYKMLIYRDNLKANLCQQNEVYLIVIPYNIPFGDIENYIRYNLPEAVASRQARQEQLASCTTPAAIPHFQQLVPTAKPAREQRAINVPDYVWGR